MIARKLSLVSAWTLVGLGLLANAGVQLAGGSQRGAFADKRSPERVERDQAGPFKIMGSTHGDGCAEVPPQAWFGAIRRLPDCVTLDLGNWPALAAEAGDVNADGRVDLFHIDYFRGLDIVSGGTAVPNHPILRRVTQAFDGTSFELDFRGVLDSDTIHGFVAASFGAPLQVSVTRVHGWDDIDEDGDLDLLLKLDVDGQDVNIWLENTGFEATQPLTGDLNSDGNVNSTDLALLLGGWTGG